MVRSLGDRTGQPLEPIKADIDRDYIVREDEAVAYGLVDEVLRKRGLPGVTAIA
jgi:ATP-dependent Clp protease protease subunit